MTTSVLVSSFAVLRPSTMEVIDWMVPFLGWISERMGSWRRVRVHFEVAADEELTTHGCGSSSID